MKYSTASVIALAGIANALPYPQFSFPSFSMPSFSMPSGLPSFGSGLGGSGSSFSSGGLPGSTSSTGGAGSSLGGGLANLGGGLGSGGLGGNSFSIPSFGGGLDGSSDGQATATPTTITTGALPTSTGTTEDSSGSNANNGASCAGSTGGSSENGVTGGTCCTDITVIFARGTGELGNMGTVSGPPMVKAIRSKLGADRVTVQGVDYAASAAGNANSGGDGGKIMAQYVQQALKQCPGTKVIVSGYSQGGMVVHNAFSNGVSASEVAGAIMFGDPLKRQALSDLSTDKVKQFCGTSDFICGGGGDGGATGSHISYGSVADSAASFAIQAAGLS
ncbi:carbohydrate esterase family 5 protein [Didymella exigua CBS 183.55]|uniref:Cutinase n=1 Tax=Didymella exigua CBS 183.55 TaxID=1150837 RepID=A0A6A5S3R6_9PLEO|nr:carbohydrate esterase family 5 protein [Didymella exigua CBS 183.55]KAF1934409.1 carbohydrate esterase family 5 protein [Didymella exigua CBS 183.55]